MEKKYVLGFCPVGNGASIHPFHKFFELKQDIFKGISGVDAVVFWGGADIHPSLYNQNASKTSQAGDKPSHRDIFEWNAMKWCVANNIPMIGVCRGAQMLCAFAGGKLVQHSTGHNSGPHSMTTNDYRSMSTTSCHHQMMYPFDIEHEMLASASVKLSDRYYDGDDEDIKMDGFVEPEVVWFPKIKGLAIQGHPEWADVNSDFAKYCNELVGKYILQIEEVEC